ncbi:hypothetical protein [Cystobacter fuscus]|uniref:hypothetical protein n=1 Tax=Cystobacter fuscus TaxID=43 RepID=UPI002B2E6940|nr:hypothetical protein F0U63_00810 [Cystobacter fuscus]
MKKIEPLWQQVITSPTASEEESAVSKLKKHITHGRISFKTDVVDGSGNRIAYADLAPDTKIQEVHIQFFADGAIFEGAPWKPRDLDNLYRLYQE